MEVQEKTQEKNQERAQEVELTRDDLEMAERALVGYVRRNLHMIQSFADYRHRAMCDSGLAIPMRTDIDVVGRVDGIRLTLTVTFTIPRQIIPSAAILIKQRKLKLEVNPYLRRNKMYE